MIVVTGATGTVGNRLTRLLAERGWPVRTLSRDPGKARAMFDDRVHVAGGDFGDPSTVDAALAGADRVFLLTAGSTEPGVQLDHERIVIASAERAAVQRVVKLSVFGADEHSPIHYLRSHHAAERALQASGLGHTILRPSGFMQNLAEWVTDGAFHTCAGDGRSPMIDARDIAEVAATVLTEDGHLGRTYPITGPAAVSFDDVAATLSAAAGHPIRHVRVSPEALITAMTAHGVPSWLADDLALQLRALSDRPESWGVTGDVGAVLGRPARSLEAYAREEFAPARQVSSR